MKNNCNNCRQTIEFCKDKIFNKFELISTVILLALKMNMLFAAISMKRFSKKEEKNERIMIGNKNQKPKIQEPTHETKACDSIVDLFVTSVRKQTGLTICALNSLHILSRNRIDQTIQTAMA